MLYVVDLSSAEAFVWIWAKKEESRVIVSKTIVMYTSAMPNVQTFLSGKTQSNALESIGSRAKACGGAGGGVPPRRPVVS